MDIFEDADQRRDIARLMMIRGGTVLIKNKLISEYRIFRKEVTWTEYVLWWAARLVLLYVLVKSIKDARGDVLILQLSWEFGISFLLPLFHILPRKVFIARLSYRLQDIVLIMLIVTAVFGQYKGFYSTVEWYDAYLHIIGCFVCVFAGYGLTMALKRDKQPLAPVVAAMCGFGFSFFFAVGWEIFEFVCDTIFVSSNSQNWSCINSAQLISFFPNIDPRRLALLDTMSDLIAGTIGSLLGGITVFPYVYFQNKKHANLKLLRAKPNKKPRSNTNVRKQQKQRKQSAG